MTNNNNTLNIDPSVLAAVQRSDRRQADRRLPKAERTRQAKEKAKAKARNVMLIDIDPQLQAELQRLAAEYRCPASGLVNLAVSELIIRIVTEGYDITRFLAPSKSPKYEYTVDPSRGIAIDSS